MSIFSFENSKHLSVGEGGMMITDDRSGLAFEVSIYGGYRKVRYEIALAWGVKNIKPQHTCLLLG